MLKVRPYMLENQENAVASVQQSEGHQSVARSKLQTKRVLVAYLNDQEKKNILLGRQPQSREDLSQLEQKIARYNEARTSRTKYMPTNPVVSESDPILDQIRSRPDITNTFAPMGLPWRPVMIDLRQVLAFQHAVRVDDLDDRVSAALQNTNALLQLFFPTNTQIGVTQEINEQGHTITTSSPHITYIPAQLTAPVGGQVVPAPAFIPQTNPNHFNIVSYKGRYFVRNGYHRAAGLLRNITQPQVIVPSILIEVQTLQQAGWQAGMIAEEILFSDYPPYIGDFWNDAYSCELLQKPKRRVFRMRLDAFDVDEFLE